MKKKMISKSNGQSELRSEYDLSVLKGGVRGKYAGTNLALLAPDVAAYFPDDLAVNAALRRLIRDAKRPGRRSRGSGPDRPLSPG